MEMVAQWRGKCAMHFVVPTFSAFEPCPPLSYRIVSYRSAKTVVSAGHGAHDNLDSRTTL